jgi:hypothetical protein
MDLSLVNKFLLLIVMNHQRTVKRLAEKPQKMNPTRSFEKYIAHLKLLKRISELIWDNPDRYSAETIV